MVRPPPRMQKFTREELWRIGELRSPGFNTEMDTSMPGAKPSPTPVKGFTTRDSRRPFAGAGKLASRSTSVSMASLGMTTGGMSSIFFSVIPCGRQSENIYVAISIALYVTFAADLFVTLVEVFDGCGSL